MVASRIFDRGEVAIGAAERFCPAFAAIVSISTIVPHWNNKLTQYLNTYSTEGV
jgi:hypothetical protein